MNNTEAVHRLKVYADAIKARGATALYIDCSRRSSPHGDLDLFIEDDHNSKFNPLDLVDIKPLRENELGMRIDATTHDGLHPMLRHADQAGSPRVLG
jgi:hypothetical protein